MLSNVLTYMIQIFVCTTGEEARMRWTLIDLSRFKKKSGCKTTEELLFQNDT